MRIGAHMRSIKDLVGTAQVAAEIGCEAVQVFAASPSSWRSPETDPEKAREFRRIVVEEDIRPVVLHTPYLLNLASPGPDIHAKSTRALGDAVRRAEALGAEYVVTHIGSHLGSGLAQGIARVEVAVSAVLDEYDLPVTILLENSAGAGNSVGARFDELRDILDRLVGYGDRVGVCLDTAHLWGAGYDVSSAEAADRTLWELDSVVGLPSLKLLHLNDTNMELGSHRDRHAKIGRGRVGEQGFAALVNHPALSALAGLIETPARTIEDRVRDIGVLKRLRGG